MGWGVELTASECVHLTDTLAIQFDAMRRMHDSIQNRVSYCRITNCVVPTAHRKLRRDNRRFASVPVLNDVDQQGTILGVQRHQKQVVQDQQLTLLNAPKFLIYSASSDPDSPRCKISSTLLYSYVRASRAHAQATTSRSCP